MLLVALSYLTMGAPQFRPQNRHGKDFVIPRVAVQRYLVFEGCLKCRTGRRPPPPTPRRRPERACKLRQRLVDPERVPCSGFLFMAGTITLAQTCNAVFAALLSLRLSMLILATEATNRGTIFGRLAAPGRGFSSSVLTLLI